ncbi:MAG TPA: hypothetical protein VJ770_06035 [Stellaceae bacterium]|nr:hypothetical protein [Stellaceae bacterium]
MTPPKRSSRKKSPLRPPPEENGVVQLKVRLLEISAMVWRHLLVPSGWRAHPTLFYAPHDDAIRLDIYDEEGARARPDSRFTTFLRRSAFAS